MSRERKSIIVTIVAVIILGGGGVFLVPKLMNANKDKESKNAKESSYSEFDENNIGELYYSPIDPEHVAEGENGIMYADNEILIVAAENVGYSEIETLATEYDAEIVGYIEQTGDYQWNFSVAKTFDEIKDIAAEIMSNELVVEASYNHISEMPVDTTYDINSGDEWTVVGFDFLSTDLINKKNNRRWSIEMINAPAAWNYLESIQNDVYPIKVGLIDDCFSVDHEDLGFAKDKNGKIQVFPKDSSGNPIDGKEADKNLPDEYTKSEASSHGTHVAGTMAALSNDGKGV